MAERELKENFLSLIKEKIWDQFFLVFFIRYFLYKIFDGVCYKVIWVAGFTVFLVNILYILVEISGNSFLSVQVSQDAMSQESLCWDVRFPVCGVISWFLVNATFKSNVMRVYKRCIKKACRTLSYSEFNIRVVIVQEHILS